LEACHWAGHSVDCNDSHRGPALRSKQGLALWVHPCQSVLVADAATFHEEGQYPKLKGAANPQPEAHKMRPAQTKTAKIKRN